MVRGPNGRFTAGTAPAGPPPPIATLPELVHLVVEPEDFSADQLPPLPPPPAQPDGGDEPGAGDVFLADALAGGINELVGLMLGAEFKAEPDKVAAVGEAAAPVMVRALSLVHADSLAESTVPAPVRELATLFARAWVAWGDAFVLITQRQIAELRAQREAKDAETGSARGGDGGVRAPGRDDGPIGNGPGPLPTPVESGEEIPPAGLDPRRAASIEHLSALDARSRRRRPN